MQIFNHIKNQFQFLKKETSCIEDAEDIIQDVFEIVFKKRQYFENKPISEQKKIVSFCVRNRFLDFYRRKNSLKRKPDIRYLSKYQMPEAPSIMELKEVKEMLLKKECRHQLIEYAHGYTMSEIVEAYGLTNIHTATARNTNARKYLKKYYLHA